MKIDISPKPELDIEHLDTAITVGTAKSPQYLIMNYSTFTSLRNQTDDDIIKSKNNKGE